MQMAPRFMTGNASLLVDRVGLLTGRAGLLALVLGGFFSASAWAGELPSRFTLGKYVPGDAWIYMHEANTPGRAWVDKKWEAVFDALRSSGLDRDVTSLALSLIPGDEDRTAAEATLEKWTGLVKSVGWSELCAKEFVYAQRIGQMPMGYEYFLLARSDRATAAKNASGIAKLLTEIAALKDGMEVTVAEQYGAKIWSMSVGDMAMKIQLLQKGDVVALTVGPDSMSEVAALMAGRGKSPSIVKTERFASAIKRADSPEFMLSFFDTKLFLGNIQGMMKGLAAELAVAKAAAAKAMAEQHGKDGAQGEKPERLRILDALTKVIDRCNVVDYILETREMDGRRELRHTMTRLQEKKKKCSLACCFLERKSFQKFDRYIPAEATAFSLSTSVDLAGIYDLLLDVVKNDFPDGPAHLAKWDGLLASTGFDPKRDLFSWWSGETIWVEMPAAVVTPMGGADWVAMIRVKNPQLAKEKIDVAIDFVSGFAQARGQTLMIGPADVKAEGFRQITHPMLMMMMRPVIGVKDEWLMLGSSSAAINKCLDVSAGKAASIVTNERFRTEGLAPKGAVMAASFKDTSKFGQELGKAVGMVGMMSGMATGMIPAEPGADKIKKAVQKAAAMIMKLGPVLQKIDFFSSESSVTTYDGEMTIRVEKVVMYKAPTEEEVKTAEAK